MELVKRTEEFSIFKKRNGRYGVKTAAGKWINGDEKIKILVGESLIKAAMPKAEPVAEEAPAEEAAATEEAPEEAAE